MAFEIVKVVFTGRKTIFAKIWIKSGDIRERLILKIKKGWKKGYEKEYEKNPCFMPYISDVNG